LGRAGVRVLLALEPGLAARALKNRVTVGQIVVGKTA
jgi:hypothetical protein